MQSLSCGADSLLVTIHSELVDFSVLEGSFNLLVGLCQPSNFTSRVSLLPNRSLQITLQILDPLLHIVELIILTSIIRGDLLKVRLRNLDIPLQVRTSTLVHVRLFLEPFTVDNKSLIFRNLGSQLRFLASELLN